MQVISFFEKLFNNFGDLVSFLDTTITFPSLSQTFVNASNHINQIGFVNVSIWTALSSSIIVFLTVCLIFHIWHLVKLIF